MGRSSQTYRIQGNGIQHAGKDLQVLYLWIDLPDPVARLTIGVVINVHVASDSWER